MEFNLGKCEVMPFRSTNEARTHHEWQGLRKYKGQRVFGGQVQRSLKTVTQVDNVVRNIFGIRAFISRLGEGGYAPTL